MDRLDMIKTFVRVVERGSFSAVARELGVGQPTISKQIAALERHLGGQLVLRTSRSLTLTDTGRDFFDSAARLIADLEAAESSVGRGLRSPSGKVRVSVAPSFGALYIVPRLHELFRRYPEIAVELLASDRSANLVEEGIDLAIRNGDLPESSLVARKIGSSPIVVVASKDYLRRHGAPKKPSELAAHSAIVFSSQTGLRAWTFAGRASYLPDAKFMTNDAEQIRAAVLAGLGIVQAPYWLFARDVEVGRVVRILQKYEPPALTIHAVRPAGQRLATKVSVFIDFMAETLAS